VTTAPPLLPPLPAYDVRLAREADVAGVCEVCREGFVESSRGLLPPATIEQQAAAYYAPDRVLREVLSAGEDPRWQGYVVAVTAAGRVLGAAGGGVTPDGLGQVYVLYLDPALRGRGVGTALLDFVTAQQRSEGAAEQWVSVTDGNWMGIPFYLARGFVVRDRVPFTTTDRRPTGAHSLRMSRPV
jgi:GNAT superfamily N-acetyltransferase